MRNDDDDRRTDPLSNEILRPRSERSCHAQAEQEHGPTTEPWQERGSAPSSVSEREGVALAGATGPRLENVDAGERSFELT